MAVVTRFVAVVLLAAVSLAVACGGSGSSSQARIVLETSPSSSSQSVSLDNVVAVLKKRLDAYGWGGSVQKSGSNQVVIGLPQNVNRNSAVKELTSPGLLEFCEPVADGPGNIAVAQERAVVEYQVGTCDPVRDAQGNIVLSGGSIAYVPWSPITGQQEAGANVNRDQIVWQSAKGDLNGQPTALTGKFLASTAIVPNPDPLAAPTQPFLLVFEFNSAGATISGEVTDRLSRRDLPLAVFLDGHPIIGDNKHIIAPTVLIKITSPGEIKGLNMKDAQKLSKLLNAGPLSVWLREVSTPSGR